MSTITDLKTGLVTVVTTNYSNPAVTSSIVVGSKCIGTVKHRSPEPSGFFVPGKFRVNPVLMYSATGKCTPASYSGVAYHPSVPSPPQYTSQLTGDLMARHALMPLPTPPANITDWALQEAYAKLNAPQVDAALMVAELAETLQLLRHPMANLTTLLEKLKISKKWVAGRNSLFVDFVGDSWLTFQYGVLPLMSDIQSIMATAENGLKANLERLFCVKGGKSTSSSSTSVVNDALLAYFKYQVKRRTEDTHKATACVYAQQILANEFLYGLGSFGFDPRQAPGLAWELVPYSFVVDWFFNVGNWIKAISPLSNYKYVGNCVSVKTESLTTVEAVAPAYVVNIYGKIQSTNSGTYTWEVNQLQRSVGLSMPALPAYSMDLSEITKILSSLALIWQKVPRSWKRRF